MAILFSRFGWCALVAVLVATSSVVLAQGNAKNGQYLATAAGCAGCHTDSQPGAAPYAGGRAVDTPFGTFFGPNITPDPETGLGNWSEQDFIRAIRLGQRLDGAHLYPAFPYSAYSGMTDSDLSDLWAYLRSLPPVNRANREHKLRFPLGWRFLVTFWKWLYFTPAQFAANPQASATVNRGAYLARALGHCSECHTPRNLLGGPKADRFLAGGKLPEGRSPNLTPTQLKKWNDIELTKYLQTGLTPDGDSANDIMDEVIRNTTSRLTPEDLAALIAYLRSLPALRDEPRN